MPTQDETMTDLAGQFATDGYVIMESLLSDAETRSLREHTLAIARGDVDYPEADTELEPGATECSLRTLRKIHHCATNDRLFMEHACNPRILDIVESFIGPDIKLYDSQCFMKPPGGVEKPYHQDSAYFAIEPRELVTCWTALDDVTLDNGAVRAVPGSHLMGLFDHSQKWMIGDREDMQVPQAITDSMEEVAFVMNAGSCSFHHSMLLHRSTPNKTQTSRRGMAVHYMSAKSQWTDPSTPKPEYALLRGREYPDCV